MISEALIVVDMQNDFMPAGVLPVPTGRIILPVINRLIQCAVKARIPVCFTADWHPRDHISFAGQGGLWPPHCIAGTKGADWTYGLDVPADGLIVRKGQSNASLGYSGFETGELEESLKRTSIRRVTVVGVALEYCVLATSQDAVRIGCETTLVADATGAINDAAAPSITDDLKVFGVDITTADAWMEARQLRTSDQGD